MLTANYTSEQGRSIWYFRASSSNCLVEQQNTLKKMEHKRDTGNVASNSSQEAEGNKGCWAMWVFASVLLGQVTCQLSVSFLMSMNEESIWCHNHHLQSDCSKAVTFYFPDHRSLLIMWLLFQLSMMFIKSKWYFKTPSFIWKRTEVEVVPWHESQIKPLHSGNWGPFASYSSKGGVQSTERLLWCLDSVIATVPAFSPCRLWYVVT